MGLFKIFSSHSDSKSDCKKESDAEIALRNFIKGLWRYNNSNDILVYHSIPNPTLAKVRRTHQLTNGNKVYFYREISDSKTFILFDEGVSLYDASDDETPLIQIRWEDLDRVEYEINSGFFSSNYFYFYAVDESDYYCRFSSYTVLKTIDDDEMQRFAEILTSFAKNFVSKEAILFKKFSEFYDSENYEESLDIINQLIEINNDEYSYHIRKGELLIRLIDSDDDEESVKLAIQEFRIAQQQIENNNIDDHENLSVINAHLGMAYYRLGIYEIARDYLIRAMDNEDNEFKGIVRERFNDVENELREKWSHYTEEYDYKDRKFIMPVNDIAGCVTSNVKVFRIENVPIDMQFPVGHPIVNELYIGHPYSSSIYIPYDGSEYVFFMDKINELCYLLQCLGAVEMSITSIKGKKVNELIKGDTTIKGGADYKVLSGDVDVIVSKGNKGEHTKKENIAIIQKFDPIAYPYLPNDLVWYAEQSDWQRLARQRIDGNMLEYHQMISTAETKFVSVNENEQVAASVGFLRNKVNANFKNEVKKQSKNNEETQWKIDVKFRSIKEFNNQENGTNKQKVLDDKRNIHLNDSEKAYEQEILFCLEDDGKIDEQERIFLERKRNKLGIKKKRAEEIEINCIKDNTLSEEENEYIDMLKEELTDGQIPHNVRRILERERKLLNIPESRAQELENMILNK